MLTQRRLKNLLFYNKRTGMFFWRKTNSRAGEKNRKGYLRIKIDGVNYFVHRLAWLYIWGYDPENSLEHKSSHKMDNRIENLRRRKQR